MQDTDTDGDPQYHRPKHDIITPERKAARNVIAIAGENRGKQYRSLTAPLDYYVLKRFINERQYDAGGKLHVTWTKTAKSPFVQARYGDEGSGGKASYLPIGIFATEYREALASIRGEKERAVAYGVCCEELWASKATAFSSQRTAERKSMRYLVSALDDLADHFRC